MNTVIYFLFINLPGEHMPQSSPRTPFSPLLPGTPGVPGSPAKPGGPGSPCSPGGPRILTPFPGKPLSPILNKK